VLAKYIGYAIDDSPSGNYLCCLRERKEDLVWRMRVDHDFPVRQCTWIALFILLSLIVCACDASFPAPTTTPSPTATQVSCTSAAQRPGDSVRTISSGGLKRSFLLHLPPTYGKYLQPLVIGYHGYSWTMQQMERVTQLNDEADKAGFLLVLPQGVDSPPSWNAGNGAYGPTGDADDVQFTHDLLTSFKKNYCVDSHRIYLVGFSLGGGMVYRLACALHDQISAIATVSGAYYPFGNCHPSHPLPVMEMHGQADSQAPFLGNPSMRMAAVQDYLRRWQSLDTCTGSSETFLQQGDVTGIEWTHCAVGSRVVHYRVGNGGHSWSMSKSINTSDVVWQFFASVANASTLY
jgi:polyhydroxybutyrate depolymerase